MKYPVPTAIVMFASATTAVASDLPKPAVTWTEFYVGGQVGGGWVDNPDSSDPNAVNLDVNGIIGGAYAGYSWQLPGANLVLGVDTDIVASGLDGSGHNRLGTSASGKWEWYGATRGRIGYAFEGFLPLYRRVRRLWTCEGLLRLSRWVDFQRFQNRNWLGHWWRPGIRTLRTCHGTSRISLYGLRQNECDLVRSWQVRRLQARNADPRCPRRACLPVLIIA